MTLAIEPIGVIRTARTDTDQTPVQSALNPDEPGAIHLEPTYAPGLVSLEGFSHLWIVTWLGREGQATGASIDLQPTPFLLRPTGRRVGVFAMRGPRRPNPIGLHLVRITSIDRDNAVIDFTGVDMVDGTPVLDLKPWVSRFDVPPGSDTRSGWFDEVGFDRVTPADLAQPAP